MVFFSPKQQAKMASHCRTILGDAILADPIESHPVCTYTTKSNMNVKQNVQITFILIQRNKEITIPF